MKLFVNFVLVFFLCIPMSINAQSGGMGTQKTGETKELMKKASRAYKLASKMAKLSDSISHATTKSDSVFFIQEKEYWSRISKDVRGYADSANCAKLVTFYAASADYWYGMLDCYNQALVNNQADSLYWNSAIEHTKKMADLGYKIQHSADLSAPKEGTLGIEDSTKVEDKQPTLSSDSAEFFKRYKILVDSKEAESKCMQRNIWILIAFCAIACIMLLALLSLAVVRRLSRKKGKKNTKKEVYVPVAEVKCSEIELDPSQGNQKNQRKKNRHRQDSSTPSLSDRLKLADPKHTISHYFEDKTKHYVEQTLSCPMENRAIYKQQLIAYFCEVIGSEECRDIFRKFVLSPLWEKEEGEEVIFALPAILDSNVFENRKVFEAKSEERTIQYIPWPKFLISEDAADTDNSNPVQELSNQLGELGKFVNELRVCLSVKPAEKEELIDETVADRLDEEYEQENIPSFDTEVAESDGDIDKLTSIFDNIDNIVNLMGSEVGSLHDILKSSGDDSAELKHKLQEKESELNSTKQQLENADQDRENAVKIAVRDMEKKLAEAKRLHKEELATAETRRQKDLAEAHKESQDYRDRLTFYTPIQKLATEVVQILDANFVAENNLDRLGILVKADLATDDFNYYLNRIRDKYARLMGDHALKNFALINELRELAHRGLVPTGGVIDGWLNKTKATLHEATLKQNLYNQLLRPYVSATIIMADECAYLLPKMQPGTVSDKMVNSFVNCSKQAKQAAERLGFEVVYAKPLEPMKKFNGVVNDEYASNQAPVNSGDIFEVLSMAVNFGGSVDKTRVSAKK